LLGKTVTRPRVHWGVPAEARIRLEREPQSADTARRFVGARIDGWGVRVDRDIVRLLVSEVVTNAVMYGDGEVVDLDIHAERGRLRIEVADENPTLPVRRRAGPAASSGRGLELVDVLALAWGVEPVDHGKVVWFEVAAGDPETTVVQLLAIPVHLYVRHATQMDDVLHEIQLRRLDSDDRAAIEGMERLANIADEAGDHFGAYHHGAMAAAELARRRGQETVDLELALQDTDARRILDLFDLLHEGDDLCRSGQLLALPATADVVRLRAWTRAEVERQLGGHKPSPFPG